MIEPIFEGARARCARHNDKLLAPKEKECSTCKLLNRNLSLKPPFAVRCNRTYYEVKNNMVYTVLWIIKDGVRDFDEHMIGYVFKTTDDRPGSRVYDATDFTPVEFLSDKERETLGKEKEDPIDDGQWYGC